MNIVSPYPLWYFFFCIILGALLAFLLYRKDRKLVEFSTLSIGVLFAFRLVVISIISALLLSPLVQYFSKTVEKPIIVIAQDNSASMLMGKDSSFIRNELNEQLLQLSEKLEGTYETVFFNFDGELNSTKDHKVSYEGKLTNYDVLFDELDNRFANRNVGGLLLTSDGIYNQGSNPVIAAQRSAYPIFPLALGDTTAYIDVKIANLRNNQLSFLGNEFPVEFDVVAQQAKGEVVTATITKDGKQFFSQIININDPRAIKTMRVNIPAGKIGKQKYTVSVTTLEGERNVLNNSVDFYIDVLDGRQKIALLNTAPHPDIAVIKRALSKNVNYEVVQGLLKDFDKPISGFDLVILHQNAGAQVYPLDAKLQELVKTNVPVLLIGGGWQNLEFQFSIQKGSRSNRKLKNESQAEVNESFTLFTIGEQLKKQLEAFPPMTVESFSGNIGKDNNTFLYQKIGSVSTNYPLLSFHEKEGRKIGRLQGEGIWKWSLADYVENKNHANFNQLIGKLVQYLAVKEDRSFFRLSAADEYFENERIVFDAQLFNPSYELVNDAEVMLKLVNTEGKEYDYTFNRSGEAYRLVVSSLPPDAYSYEANVVFQGKTLKETGVLTVKELQLEKMNSEADHNLLYQIARKSGGELLYPSDLNDFSNRLKERKDIASISYMNKELEDIINLKWIFFLIVGLLGIEWLIRKRGGAY